MDYIAGATMSPQPPDYPIAYQAFIISALAGVAAFVGHIYPGLARLQGRQGRRNVHRRGTRLLLAGGTVLLRRVAGDGRRVSHIVAGGAGRERRRIALSIHRSATT